MRQLQGYGQIVCIWPRALIGLQDQANMLCFWEESNHFPKDEPEQELPEPDPGCLSKSNLCSEPVPLLPPEAMTAVTGSQKAFLKQVFTENNWD